MTIMRYKRFVSLFVGIMVFFVALNYVVWKVWTEDLLTDKNYIAGDLTRMGYIFGYKMYRKNYCDLPFRHIEADNYAGQKIDVLTIGDSFSNGGGGGRNRFYQDYIASINRFTVLNIHPYKNIDSLTTVSALCNNGIIDRLKPRFILIESSQKFCIDDFAKPIDFELTIPSENREPFSRTTDVSALPSLAFINNGNFKFLLYNLLYPISDHAFFGKVCIRELTTNMFSVKNGTRLLFLRNEVKRATRATPELVFLLNRNLNILADKLSDKGINLYFMPCVDKYTLYSDYLSQNTYPKSTFFEELRKLPKKYNLIDTKEILSEELKKGAQDIFYADDTHWSWKASAAIFRKQLFR